MRAYTIRRILALIPVLLIVGGIAFLLLQFIPGDPAVVMAGPDATQEEIARLRERMGLDDPVLVQLLRWYSAVFRGDLGRSIYFRQPVTQILLQRFEPTMLLALMALLIAIVFGVPLGIVAAVRRNTFTDRSVMVFSVLGMSIPPFWKLLNLILLLSVWYRIFPVSGYVPLRVSVTQALRHLALPAISLGIGSMALMSRMTRSAMLGVLREDYIRTARSKGLSERTVIYGHALKNALIPVVTVIGLTSASLLGGAVVTESVTAIPGMGRMVVQSVLRRDYPMLQGLLVTISGIYVIINLLVDLLYVFLDPRVKYN